MRFASFTLLALLCGLSLKAQQGQRLPKACGVDQITAELNKQSFQRPLPAQLKVEDDGTRKYVIPVVVHVLYEMFPDGFGGYQPSPSYYVDYFQVLSQIDVFNEDFNRYGMGFNDDSVGASANIVFCLASIDPQGKPTDGVNKVLWDDVTNWQSFIGGDSLMKKATQWDPERYYNIWTTGIIDGGNISGYTYYPKDVAGTILDGSVVHFWQMGRNEGTAVALGKTCSHEAGHWLGLYHTWGPLIECDGDECCEDDDECDDTPLADVQGFAAPPSCSWPGSCGSPTRQVANYMDYSDDECQNLFTKCQVEKMRNAIVTYRFKMVSQENLIATGCYSTQYYEPVTDLIDVYPNPASDAVMVTFDYDEWVPVFVSVFDWTGRAVRLKYQAGFGRGNFGVDLINAPSGLYTVKVEGGTHTLTKTIWITN